LKESAPMFTEQDVRSIAKVAIIGKTGLRRSPGCSQLRPLASNLIAVAHLGTDRDDRADFILDRHGVLDRQGRRTAPTTAHAAAGEVAGENRMTFCPRLATRSSTCLVAPVVMLTAVNDRADADDDTEPWSAACEFCYDAMRATRAGE